MEATPRKSGWQGPRRRAAATLVVVPLAFLLFASVWPCRQFHWDTLERAYLLDHPSHYLRSWDGSPRSQFLSFAHVLELPLAWLVGAVLPGDGLRALIVFEALAAAFTLWVLGSLVLLWRRAPAAPAAEAHPEPRARALGTACLAQGTLGLALAFWKLGSSGQEKSLALSTQLLFLLVFWRALAVTSPPGPRRVTNSSSLQVAWDVAASLAFAILAHLSGVVLVPFAVLALLLGMHGAPRARQARGVAIGALVAGLSYYAVAAWTTGVRGPVGFLEYITFFHRPEGINFWEPSGSAAASPGNRLSRLLGGLAAFFAGEAWAAAAALLLLAAAIAMPFFRSRRRHARRGRAAEAASGLRTLHHHALLLGGLWTVHFAFFEPQNYESWTLVAALLVLVAAASLRKVSFLAATVLPLLLLAGNLRHYAANHREMPLEGYRRALARASRPGDLVVMAGGMSERTALPGSLAMRYFLARLPGRTVVSLYDVLGLAGREYWGRPVESPAALQAALDAGRRAWAPSFALSELEHAGLRLAPPALGDSVVEITGVGGRSVPPP